MVTIALDIHARVQLSINAIKQSTILSCLNSNQPKDYFILVLLIYYVRQNYTKTVFS